MSSTFSGWNTQRYDDGQEVLSKTVRLDSLKQTFDCAYRITEAMAGTEAEKDFTVSADPTAVVIVLHAYSKGSLPTGYIKLAKQIDEII